MDLEKIQAIIGLRRVGKTSAMRLAIEELKTTRGKLPGQIIYFNFEDERVQFEPHQLDFILQAWQELNPQTSLENACSFLTK
ncbi:MAG: AAA family ATPase [Pedobacter sp.]